MSYSKYDELEQLFRDDIIVISSSDSSDNEVLMKVIKHNNKILHEPNEINRFLIPDLAEIVLDFIRPRVSLHIFHTQYVFIGTDVEDVEFSE
jgi:hypothetical protein